MIHHTVEKSYKCKTTKTCLKKCSSSQSVKIHMSIHTGEETYKCDICNKGFHHNRHFDIHMTKHTWLKPHKVLSVKKPLM